MKPIMKRTGRGVWVGMFPLGEAAPTTVEHDVRVYLSRISLIFSRSEVNVASGSLRVLVEIRTHVPGRGFGTDSAVIGNVQYVVLDIIDRAQPSPKKSAYEWLRAPAV